MKRDILIRHCYRLYLAALNSNSDPGVQQTKH